MHYAVSQHIPASKSVSMRVETDDSENRRVSVTMRKRSLRRTPNRLTDYMGPDYKQASTDRQKIKACVLRIAEVKVNIVSQTVELECDRLIIIEHTTLSRIHPHGDSQSRIYTGSSHH
ncbi:hypothetical protein AG1IA_06271 [Rhizoctonia solani AG-1 IA]|uniref:Uncharacterized protein n=1 Tax=Thanatephorus cucumeris (strain AG1-IA) TaxID=983506 RepID=L8WTL2_THACA|nr:hypothetical protein AG1IA_06271 [Rhizoctonia solani AG-1 IA]